MNWFAIGILPIGKLSSHQLSLLLWSHTLSEKCFRFIQKKNENLSRSQISTCIRRKAYQMHESFKEWLDLCNAYIVSQGQHEGFNFFHRISLSFQLINQNNYLIFDNCFEKLALPCCKIRSLIRQSLQWKSAGIWTRHRLRCSGKSLSKSMPLIIAHLW